MGSPIEELEKTVAEALIFSMDFSNRLASGEIINSVQQVTGVSQGVHDTQSTVSIDTITRTTNSVQFRISGGIVGEQYLISCVVLTNFNNVIEGLGLLRILQ